MEGGSRLIAMTALFTALALALTFVRITLPLGNPNLGSTAISLSALFLPPGLVFVVGVAKGLGASLWTGQALIELPAGLGDGVMGLITAFLARRIRPSLAIIVGQSLRYYTTSTPIAVALALAGGGDFLSSFTASWLGIAPAVTISIIGNMVVSYTVAEVLMRVKPPLGVWASRG